MDFLDYMDEIYEELVSEFGHEIESECIHEWYKSQGTHLTDTPICQWQGIG